MDLTAKKNDIEGKKLDVLAEISKRLEQKFEKRKFGKRECFVNKNKVPFNVHTFQTLSAFVIEYAESDEDAMLDRFEDGDVFYWDEFHTEQDILDAMLKEIESAN